MTGTIPPPAPAPEAASGGPRWQLAAFDALQPRTLYELLRLRSEVFVVEQSCVFQDVDGLDPQALHLLGWQGAELVAVSPDWARLLVVGWQDGPVARDADAFSQAAMAAALDCR